MKTIIVTLRDGSEQTVEADESVSLMEALRDNGIDELLALCGGCCSCATCHVHLSDDVTASLGDKSEDEDDLLDSSEHKTEQSSLSCQVNMSELPAGCKVVIAQED